MTGLSLIVDENPGPLAARVRFGPAGDPRALGLRVRVDGYTNVHAVATLADGSMVANAAFVKGAGGCSAPIGVSDVEAMAGMGDMRMKFAEGGPEGAGKATLMVRHPNFNGMQMNQVTRLYTPARYVTDVEVTRGGELVFAMQSDISLATNPVIDFLYRRGSDAPFTVSVTDSEGQRWSQEFPAPGADELTMRRLVALLAATLLLAGAGPRRPTLPPEPDGYRTGDLRAADAGDARRARASSTSRRSRRRSTAGRC